MMGHNPYNHDLIKKATIIFGGLFNDVRINRSAADASVEQVVNVPLNYGPSEKMLTKIRNMPDLTPAVAITLPRMSFEFADLFYSPDRKLPPFNQTLRNGHLVYSPMPYNFIFRLYIMANQTVDGTRVLEQIIPFFTPTFNVPGILVPEFGCSENIPITLDSISKTDSFEGSFDDRRTQIWTLQFTMQVNMYGPVSDYTDKLIKHIEIGLHDKIDKNSTSIANITIQPGLTANGTPTTNVADSIPWANINYSDDWAFIVDFESD